MTELVSKLQQTEPKYPEVPQHIHVNVTNTMGNVSVIDKAKDIANLTVDTTKDALDVVHKSVEELKQVKLQQILNLSKYERDYYKIEEIMDEVKKCAAEQMPFNVPKKLIKAKTIQQLYESGQFNIEEPEPTGCNCLGNSFKGIETLNITFKAM